jgi:hypothetical protein
MQVASWKEAKTYITELESVPSRLVDYYLVLSLLVYVIAFAGIMLSVIFYDSKRAYNQRERLIAAFKELRAPGTDAAAVAKAATDAAKSYDGTPSQAAADAVAKAATDAAAKNTGDAGTDAAAVAKAATDAAKSYDGTPSQAAADAVAKAATDAAKDGAQSGGLIATFEKLIPSPEGMEGEGRLAMTLGFVGIIGIVMIQLLLSSAQLTNTILATPVTSANNATLKYAETTSASQIDLIKTIVTILSGAVTAMIGFYFGSRSAAKSEASPPEGKSDGSGSEGSGSPRAPARKVSKQPS